METRRGLGGGTRALLILTVLMGALARPAYTSAPVVAWARTYDGVGARDEARSVVRDGAGNVYVTGLSTGTGTNFDYATVKYDASGNQLWARRYNGTGNNDDRAAAVVVDAGGNVYVTGYSTGTGTNQDYATVKYDSSGTQQWAARYDNSLANGDDEAAALSVDADGNVYVTGYSTGSGGNTDYATVKYSAEGTQLWAQRYNGPSNSEDQAVALVTDGSGNAYVTGYSGGSGTGTDYATIKYSSAGAETWVTRYNSPTSADDRAAALALDGSGNVYVTGYAGGNGVTADYATLKYNSGGTQQWVSFYNGTANSQDRGRALAVDSTGNVYVTGYSYGGVEAQFDYATVKYNGSGVQQWEKRYNGPGSNLDEVKALVLDGLGNVYVSGHSYGGTSTGYDVATLGYDSAGNELWAQRYASPGNVIDVGNALTADSLGNVYVTGYTEGSGGNDYLTLKYSPPPPNVAPVVQANKTVTVLEDAFATSLGITAPADANGDSLTILVDTVPTGSQGVVRRPGGVVAAGNTLTISQLTGAQFEPAPDANGSAGTFQYTVTDGQGGSASQTVTLAITPVNDAPVALMDQYSVAEDGTLTVTASGVLGNDTDLEGDALSATLAQNVAHGTLTLHGDGSFSYQPSANYNGPDSFTYVATDLSGDASEPATVAIKVSAQPDAPVAQNCSVSAPSGSATALTLKATDADGDSLTYTVLCEPKHGTLTGTGSARSFTPTPGYLGPDKITFKANDGSADSNVGTISITITAGIVAVADNYGTKRGTPLTVAAPGILTNDLNSGGPLTAVLVSGPQNGTLTLRADGSFVYRPRLAFAGTDKFTYYATSGGQNSTAVNVILVVQPAFPAPGAVKAVGAAAFLAGNQQYRFVLEATSAPGTAVKGTFQLIGPPTGLSFSSTQLTAVVLEGTTLRLYGRGREKSGSLQDFVVEIEEARSSVIKQVRLRFELNDGRVVGPANLTSGTLTVH